MQTVTEELKWELVDRNGIFDNTSEPFSEVNACHPGHAMAVAAKARWPEQ